MNQYVALLSIRSLLVVASVSLSLPSGLCRQAEAQERPYPTLGTIERLDPRLDTICAAEMRGSSDWLRDSTGRKDRSGTVAVLLFSDVPQNTVFQWQEGKGVSVFLKPSGYTARARAGVGRAPMDY